MVVWMRIRGHGWRHGFEMAAAMLIPWALLLMLAKVFSPLASVADWAMYAGMLVYITRSDGGTYDQSNDYSYNGSASALTVTDRITVYYKGTLIYGTEP